MLLLRLFSLLALPLGLSYGSTSQSSIFHPTSHVVAGEPNHHTSSRAQSFTLTPIESIVTLDYGYEVAGYPFFDVSSLEGRVQIEVKYSEAFDGLLSPYSDGPFVYNIGLSNTFRVETFEISKTGRLDAFLIQGGQRWQSIRLITNGSVSFSRVGLRATIDRVVLKDMPGYFQSESKLINDVWNLGARAVSTACITAGSQKAIWEVSPENGALVRGMRTALSSKAENFSDYNLTFYSKIARGGIGWAVAHPLSTVTGAIQLNIIGELPEATTFVNTNRILTPSNTLVLGFGWTPFVNQTTLSSYRLEDVSIPFPIHEGQWYKISTRIRARSLQVSINDQGVLNTSISNYWLPPSILSTASFNSSSFGFGGYQDQAAYIKNVTVTASDDKILYSNPMTSISILEEYGVHENYATVCLDGPKRDRLVWLGDFFHTARIIGATTGRWDFVTGTLRDFIAWQSVTTGLLPIAQNLGYPASSKSLRPLKLQGNLSLMDYQLLGFLAFYGYVEETGDVKFVRSTWSAWKVQLEYLIGNINATTGLVDFPGVTFIGPGKGGSAVSCAMVETLNHASALAFAINDTSSAKRYQKLAKDLADNINSKLWNEELGVYSIALSDRGNFSINGISFAITSGVASPNRAGRSLANLDKLRLGPGYKDSTTALSTDPTVNISPNTNGFLLNALMTSNHSTLASSLIQTLWGAMISNRTTTTGASWEYVSPQGQPGLGLFTSLSHPWGGAATYILTKYAAGIRPVKWGYESWVIEPGLGFGLTDIRAGVATPRGRLGVEWKIEKGKKARVAIDSPRGTKGALVIGDHRVEVLGGGRKSFVLDIG